MSRPRFDDNAREEIFYLWYNKGKPSATKLWMMIPDGVEKPSRLTLGEWISKEFAPRGEELDLEAREQFDQMIVAEKVQMLHRHAQLGEKMQSIGMKFLDEHSDDVTVPTAVRLLVEGVRIERDSRGLPDVVENVNKMTDDELIEQVKKIFLDSPIARIEPGLEVE